MQDEQLEYILDRVNRIDQSRGKYKLMAKSWQRMWEGDAGFDKTQAEAIMEGREQIVLPTPFNVVNLSQRLLATMPKIDVIPADPANRESVEYAGMCEKWLTSMWRRINYDQRRNVLADAIWYALVRGRFAFEVKWIRDSLPKTKRKKTFPILIRTLDPLNVGIEMGPYGTEFAYHKYETSLLDVMRRWPELKNAKSGTRMRQLLDKFEDKRQPNEDLLVNVVDYWDMNPDDGTIWNAIIVEDEFAKEYVETSYPDVPIVCGRGDYAVGIGDEYDGLSILHTIDGLWQYQCRLTSQMASGLLWHFWPAVVVQNENNVAIDDINVLPGGTIPVPWGTKVDLVRVDPNVPLAQEVFRQIDGHVQQSTYPEVMYGRSPTDFNTGYGVSLLSEAAQGRIKNFQESLEMTLAHVHSVVLALVEKKAGKQGIDVYAVNEVDREKYRLTLTKEMINGNYENEVRIKPAIPADDANRVVIGKQLADGKYISSQLLRDEFVGVAMPSDETRRIALEEAMQSDEMRPYRLRRAIEDYYGDDALTIMYDAKAPFMPEPPAGMKWEKGPDGKVKAVPVNPQPQPPLPMGPGGPPMPPEGPMGMPPGPPMPPEGPMGPGGPPMQPPGVAGPMGGGFPPSMTGQFEGETLGMDPNMDPNLFAALMNNPLPPNEQLKVAAGMPR